MHVLAFARACAKLSSRSRKRVRAARVRAYARKLYFELVLKRKNHSRGSEHGLHLQTWFQSVHVHKVNLKACPQCEGYQLSPDIASYLHSVGLASSCLSVGDNGSIVSAQAGQHCVSCSVVVHASLVAARSRPPSSERFDSFDCMISYQSSSLSKSCEVLKP